VLCQYRRDFKVHTEIGGRTKKPVLSIAFDLQSEKLPDWTKVGPFVIGVKKLLEFGYSFDGL
jgi:hypothetical protein